MKGNRKALPARHCGRRPWHRKAFLYLFQAPDTFFYFIPVHIHFEEALMDDKGKFFLVARFAAQKFPIKELRIKGS